MKNFDTLVIGGGLAGSMLARQLVLAGERVLVIDRSVPGRNKVCGGFLGPEVQSLFRKIDLAKSFDRLEKASIRTFVLSGPSTRRFEIELPEPGIGIDRAQLDFWLWLQAKEAGAVIRPECHVKSMERRGGIFHVTLSDAGVEDRVSTRTIVLATGRRNLTPSSKKQGRWYFGCKTVYEGLGSLENGVALHFVRGGHVGFNQVSPTRSAMCLYVEKFRISESGGNLDHMMKNFAGENSAIREHLRQARRVEDWHSCQAQLDGQEVFYRDQIFRVGDAVTMLHPIVGGGMSAALGSSMLLAKTLIEGRKNRMEDSDIAMVYEKLWKKEFAFRLRFSQILGECEKSQLMTNTVLRLLNAVPAIHRNIVSYSRPALVIP